MGRTHKPLVGPFVGIEEIRPPQGAKITQCVLPVVFYRLQGLHSADTVAKIAAAENKIDGMFFEFIFVRV